MFNVCIFDGSEGGRGDSAVEHRWEFTPLFVAFVLQGY